jgi:hypothetical protein
MYNSVNFTGVVYSLQYEYFTRTMLASYRPIYAYPKMFISFIPRTSFLQSIHPQTNVIKNVTGLLYLLLTTKIKTQEVTQSIRHNPP